MLSSMKVQMTLLKALFVDFPEFSLIDLAESVGVSSLVSCGGGPVHLCWPASGPGGDCRSSKQAILIMLRSWLAANISIAPPPLADPSRPATATTTSKHIIFPVTAVRISSVEATPVTKSRSCPRGCPGVEPGRGFEAAAFTEELLVNCHLGH